jgi:hypothetical protein
MTCPECGSSEVRASSSTRWNDFLQRVRGREAFRCRKCRLRFFASPSSDSGSKPTEQSTDIRRPNKLMSTRSKKRLVRRLIAVVIFAAAFALFWFFLRYLTTERMPTTDSGAVNSSLSFFTT